MFIIMLTKFELKSVEIHLFHVTAIVVLAPDMCMLEFKYYEIKLFLKL